MSGHLSKLNLEWRKRTGGGGRTERDYLDFIVDGQSLRDVIAPGDFIGCLGWLPAEVTRRFADELLLKLPSELPGGRNLVYICPECGDFGCGAVTVEIKEDDEAIIWTDFRFENDTDLWGNAARQFQHVGPFRFLKSDYEKVITRQLPDER